MKIVGETLTGNAEMTFNIAEFGMVEPSSNQLLSIDVDVKPGVTIVALKSA